MIRNRTAHNKLAEGGIEVSAGADDFDKREFDRRATFNMRQPTLAIIALLFGLICIIVLTSQVIPKYLPSIVGGSGTRSTHSNVVLAKNWSHCNANATNPKVEAYSTNSNSPFRPLWLAAYPTSLPGKNGVIFSDFLSAFTGISTAARNYYRSSKILKRCHSLNNPASIGVTCEIVHPIVPCERPHPSLQSENFGRVVLLAIRNPSTAFYAYYQDKAEKYHNVKGQVTMKDWIEFSDVYVGNSTQSPLFEEWKNFITEWRNMHPYQVAMYLPYESWSDDVKGIDFIKRLGKVLKDEGFPVQSEYFDDDNKPTSDRELECFWFRHIHERTAVEERRHVDDGWYTPDFRFDQKNMLVENLEKFAKEIDMSKPSDIDLVTILYKYRDSVLKTMQ